MQKHNNRVLKFKLANDLQQSLLVMESLITLQIWRAVYIISIILSDEA